MHDGSGSGPGYVRSPAQGFEGVPPGSDLITDPGFIRAEFPYLDPSVVAVLHARRCGWLSAQQLGMWMLERGARARREADSAGG